MTNFVSPDVLTGTDGTTTGSPTSMETSRGGGSKDEDNELTIDQIQEREWDTVYIYILHILTYI